MENKLKKVIVSGILLVLLIINVLPLQVISAENSKDSLKEIDEYVENQRKEYNIPGLSIGVVKGNETIYLKGFGQADSSGTSVTPQTPFMIGSVSKSFTALAIIQLVDSGKINLDESVDQYLPWFKATYKGKEQKITIRQLLHHTSGMKDFYANSVPNNTTINQLVKNQLNHTSLRTMPGKVSYYSNANYIILGEVIQSVSKLPYQEYIKEYIFEPLEMEHSYLSKNEAVENNLAAGNRKWFGFPVETKAADISFFEYSLPEGYIISCAEDMTHYISALMNEGNYKNISIATKGGIESLFNEEVEEECVQAGIDGTQSFYGFGWRIIRNNGKLSMLQHTGETAHYHANIVILPDEHIGVIELANFGGDLTPTSIGIGAANIVAGKEPPPVSALIKNVYLVMRIVVILIIMLLIIACIRLKGWRKRIRKSKGRYLYNIVFMGIVNFSLPLWIFLFLPAMFNSKWKSNLDVFPDISWTAIITSSVLIIIGVIKGILLIVDGNRDKIIEDK